MHAVEASDFWEAHYRAGELPWDLGGPAPMLLAWLAENPGAGRSAVVLGAGRGHDAVALAAHGWRVTALDFAASAVAQARDLARGRGVEVEVVEADIFRLDPAWGGRFTLLWEHTCFCAIDPARRDDYVAVARRLLAPGGRLAGLFFTHGQPGGPPHDVRPEELRRFFAPSFTIDTLVPAPHSVPARAGEEHWGLFTRRPDA